MGAHEITFTDTIPVPSPRETLHRFYRSDHLRANLMEQGIGQDQVSTLFAITPDEFLELGEARNGDRYTYVSIHYVRGMLSYAFAGMWNDKYEEHTVNDGEIIVKGTLRVLLPKGTELVHDAVGGYSLKDGEKVSSRAITIAQANCLKNATAKIGIAWDVACGLTIHPALRATPEKKVIILSGERISYVRNALGKAIVAITQKMGYPPFELGKFLSVQPKKTTGHGYVQLDEKGDPVFGAMDEQDAAELINHLVNPASEAKLRARFIAWAEETHPKDAQKLTNKLKGDAQK
jgi:hypothetical protein